MNRPRGLLLDLDGTIYVETQPIEGAIDTVTWLRTSGYPLRFVTNTTRQPVSGLIKRLQAMGLGVDASELFTAPRAAANWLHAEGLLRVYPLLPEPTWEDLQGLTLVDDEAQAVLVGDLGDQWSRAKLDRAFRLLKQGARLVAIQKNRYSEGAYGLELDVGAFVAALEYAADTQAVVIGKPNLSFFMGAAADLGLLVAEVAMVGDDLENDVAGAQRAGARGILVRTGKYRPSDESRPEVQPDAVIDSLADLPRWLSSQVSNRCPDERWAEPRLRPPVE